MMGESAAETSTGGGTAFELLRAAHLPPVVTVTALAAALAAAWGRGPSGTVLVALAVLSGQLSVGWSNDRIDLRRDLAARRKDKPLVRGGVRPVAVTAAAAGALAACVPLSLAGGAVAGSTHLAAVAAAWCYNVGVKRTALSWLPYALGFGLLPAYITLGLPDRPWPPGWVMAAGALLGTGAHFTNVLPDIDADLAEGVRGLPQRLGRRRAGAAAAVLLLAASAVLVLGRPGRPGWSDALGLAASSALALGAVTRRGRVPFLATLALAAVDVGLLLLRGHQG